LALAGDGVALGGELLGAAGGEHGGQPGEWVASEFDLRVFGVRRLGLFGEVQVVGLAPAREGGVGELLAQAGVGEQEGGIGGQTLGDVAGERVAVKKRGAALAVAVGDAVLVVVALDHDQVAGGERAARQLQLGAVEAACGAHRVACELVELGDVAAAMSQDDRVLARLRGSPPVFDQPGPGLVGGGSGVDAAVLLVGGNRLVRAAVGDVVEGAAFPWFGLALVVDELDGESARDEGAETAAGLDLGHLAVVADKDELAVRVFDVLE
jgi:hypothetical protein